MIDAVVAARVLVDRGYGFVAGVACSYVSPLADALAADASIPYIEAANEGDAVAMAVGATLAGRRSAVTMQNSGLGNAVNPLTSLVEPLRIPVLLFVSWRGEPGTGDEPQHRMMGEITPQLLELMGITWERLPETVADLEAALHRAEAAAARREPYAFLVPKGSLQPHPTPVRQERRRPAAAPPPTSASGRASRMGLLEHLVAATDTRATVLVATTGYTGRELYAVDDRENHLYMVGSMGCALSIGLGMAVAAPQRTIIVLDGDGALLMRLGALAAVGTRQPANLVHVLFDNGVHLSTGAQPTAGTHVDFTTIAASCGYRSLVETTDPERVVAALTQPGPVFVRVPTEPIAPADLPRPSVSPDEVATRVFNLFAEAR